MYKAQKKRKKPINNKKRYIARSKGYKQVKVDDLWVINGINRVASWVKIVNFLYSFINGRGYSIFEDDLTRDCHV